MSTILCLLLLVAGAQGSFNSTRSARWSDACVQGPQLLQTPRSPCRASVALAAAPCRNHTRRLMQDGSYAASYASASSSGSTVSTTAYASGSNAAASAGAAVTTTGGQDWSSGSVPNLGQQSPQQQQQYDNSLQNAANGGNDNSNGAQFTDLINSLIGNVGSGNSGTYTPGTLPP